MEDTPLIWNTLLLEACIRTRPTYSYLASKPIPLLALKPTFFEDQ